MKTTILTTIMTNLLRREVRKFKPGESEPLPDGSAGGLNAAARPEEERLTTDKTSKKQEPTDPNMKRIAKPCLLLCQESDLWKI